MKNVEIWYLRNCNLLLLSSNIFTKVYIFAYLDKLFPIDMWSLRPASIQPRTDGQQLERSKVGWSLVGMRESTFDSRDRSAFPRWCRVDRQSSNIQRTETYICSCRSAAPIFRTTIHVHWKSGRQDPSVRGLFETCSSWKLFELIFAWFSQFWNAWQDNSCVVLARIV